MNTTAGRTYLTTGSIELDVLLVGSFALLGSVVPRDAGVAAKLRAAGAVSPAFPGRGQYSDLQS
jgi:hypothetical protein